MATESLNIGFVGLGNLGEPLCNSLVKAGYKVTVTDLNKSSAKRLLDGGASWSDDVAGVCREADVVITALPSPAASRKVVEGPGGVFESLRAGSVWIEMSTTDFQDLQRLQGLAQARGIEVLECPVTGGVHLAHSGQITVLVGGEPATAERVDAILHVMGGEVIYLGKLGSASVVKVVTNMLAFIHLVAAGEAMMVPAKYGVDPDATYRAPGQFGQQLCARDRIQTRAQRQLQRQVHHGLGVQRPRFGQWHCRENWRSFGTGQHGTTDFPPCPWFVRQPSAVARSGAHDRAGLRLGAACPRLPYRTRCRIIVEG